MPSRVCTLRDDQLAELVDVAGLGAHDHVVGTGDVLGEDDALDVGDALGDLGGLADIGLDQDVGLDDHVDSLAGSEGLQRLETYRTTSRGRNTAARGARAGVWWDGVMTPPQPFAPDATLADVGEFGLIAALTARFEQGPHVFVGPGDDAAVAADPEGSRRGLHRPAGRGAALPPRLGRARRDIGRKAAAANLSDINAMGGTAALADRRARAPRPTCRRSGRSTWPTASRRRRPGRREHRRRRPDHRRPRS